MFKTFPYCSIFTCLEIIKLFLHLSKFGKWIKYVENFEKQYSKGKLYSNN